MKTIQFWDKESPINGIEASEILKDAFFRSASSIFLIVDSYSHRVTNIENTDVIRSTLSLGEEYTDQEVADQYLEYLENIKNIQAEEAIQPMMANAYVQEEETIDLSDILKSIEDKLDLILEKLNK